MAKYRAYNRFDEEWFEFETDKVFKSLILKDAVDAWNSTHIPYFEIGPRCIRTIYQA